MNVGEYALTVLVLLAYGGICFWQGVRFQRLYLSKGRWI